MEDAGLGVQLEDGSRVGGLMFADDFAGLEGSAERLQQLIDVAAAYLQQWGLEANVAKSAVVVYGPARGNAAPERLSHVWKWGGADGPTIPRQQDYKYLGVVLGHHATWTSHVDEVVRRGKAALAKHSRVLASRSLDRAVRLLVYKQYVRPVLE